MARGKRKLGVRRDKVAKLRAIVAATTYRVFRRPAAPRMIRAMTVLAKPRMTVDEYLAPDKEIASRE